jgi:hypothetical protein
MFRKLARIAGVAAVAAALLVPTAIAAGPNGTGPGTGTCPQAGTCVPKLDGTGRGSVPNSNGTCTPKRDGTGGKHRSGGGQQHRGMQGWKVTQAAR